MPERFRVGLAIHVQQVRQIQVGSSTGTRNSRDSLARDRGSRDRPPDRCHSQNPVPQHWADMGRNHSSMLDGPIADAETAVETIGRRQSSGRAGLETKRTGTAQVAGRKIGFKVQRQKELSKEEPRPTLRIEKIGVLTHATQSCSGGHLSFQDRTGVHIDLGARLGKGLLGLSMPAVSTFAP